MLKWVGFDMDECMGSLMPLYAFVTRLPNVYTTRISGKPEVIYEAMKNALYISENYKLTWLLRPAFYDALIILYNAYKNGKIHGAFIFSNNGSQELVDFMVYYCNGWIARKINDESGLSVFKMGVSRESPLRSPGSLIKNLSEIQNALVKKGLPIINNENDLLFFDDMKHELAHEIRNYVQVRPYLNLCPLERVINALEDIEEFVGSEAWGEIVKLAQFYRTEDKRINYIETPPTIQETVADAITIQQAFSRFFGQRAGAFKKSHKTRKSLRQRSRRLVAFHNKNNLTN